MKEDENIFEKAVKSLKNQQVPPGPSDELAKATIEKLNNASEQPDTIEFNRRLRITDRITLLSGFVKFAAAAVFLIIAGFAAGRLTTTKPPDMEQIRASLEPAIRSRLLGEMKQYMQLGLANSYVRLKDDLTEQYRQDLNQLAANIVAANGNMTNQLLENLIESVDAAQTQDRQLFAAALEQVELNRQRDNAQLSNALVNFAVQTGNELNQTKQDMAELFKYTQSEDFAPNELNNPNNIN
jgi:hypothetical protein